MNISITRNIMCCLFMAIIAGHVPGAMAADGGTITAVSLASDAHSLVIQHNGRIGAYSSFVLQNPSRLVLDVNETQLARIPRKIPVYWARINEIRVGHTDFRSRIVIDFGKNPVPPFHIERGSREIVVNWEKGVASRSDRLARQDRPKERHGSWAKQASSSTPRRQSSAVQVRSARMDRNRVIVELGDNRTPGKAYTLAVEMDGPDLNVRGATVRDGLGMVKRFQLATEKDSISGVQVETFEPWDRMGPQSGETVAADDNQPQLKRGLQAAQDTERPMAGPTKRGPMRMEGFALQKRAEQGG